MRPASDRAYPISVFWGRASIAAEWCSANNKKMNQTDHAHTTGHGDEITVNFSGKGCERGRS
jgi:hypothetical protein